jgi:hypothetical protein
MQNSVPRSPNRSNSVDIAHIFAFCQDIYLIVNILINRVIYAGTAHPTYNGLMLGSWLEGLKREFTMNKAAYA